MLGNFYKPALMDLQLKHYNKHEKPPPISAYIVKGFQILIHVVVNSFTIFLQGCSNKKLFTDINKGKII